MIHNPILPGFNPDPAIIRVGDDYYIATSSFEWFPGIPIYHSKDLVHWKLIDYALKSKQHIDLTCLPPSKGVWAPCLSYCEAEKRYYMIYSNVYNTNELQFDVDNFLIWSDSIHGPWSEPVYINSNGFDPSIFHDDDGRKWVMNQERDFRPGHQTKRPILLQEYCPQQRKLIGRPIRLTYGATKRGFTEAPHIYKRNGWYYLITAEGGTGYGHCVALLRSKKVTGPYEAYPNNPVITSCTQEFEMRPEINYAMLDLYNPDVVIQKAGHGSLVETQTGEWYIAHLCGRPVMPQKRCVLGRETAIQKVEWTDDGWLRMADGTNIAKDHVPAPRLPAHPFPKESPRCDFDSPTLDLHFCTPRNEITPDWANLTARPGYLRLRGRESLTSNHHPSLIARRLTSLNATVTTKMEFSADFYQQLAGLTFYYESSNFYSIYKTYSEELDCNIVCVNGLVNREYVDGDNAYAVVEKEAPLYLRAQADKDGLQFSFSTDGKLFNNLGPVFDLTTLSDEASCFGEFTGTFVGVFAQDSHTREKYADFNYFEYIDNL
ncbi:MAG TPA: glycoside hydrolase family 43 protein [Thermoclostridium sp.]|nr:glycoside hydrolase family 43 protein [Thermoclostridium sp.]